MGQQGVHAQFLPIGSRLCHAKYVIGEMKLKRILFDLLNGAKEFWMETLPASNQSGTLRMPAFVRSCINKPASVLSLNSLQVAVSTVSQVFTEGIRIPATAVMANLLCTSSAC